MKSFKNVFIRFFSTLALIFLVCPTFFAANELTQKDIEVCREFVRQRCHITRRSTLYIDLALRAWRQDIFKYLRSFSIEKQVKIFRLLAYELYGNPCSMFDEIDSFKNVEISFDGSERPTLEMSDEKISTSGMIICRVPLSRYTTAIYYL